jgi:uncharacterized membrane protein YphA (DoxX/SURF4 family)
MNAIVYFCLFIRLLLGVVLLSAGSSKLFRPARTRQDIQEYQLIPAPFERTLALSQILALCLPVEELVVSIGLISGYYFTLAIIMGLSLFLLFTIAIIINLRRGRRDLSCHCAGALGDHHISWELVIRNSFFFASLLLLLTSSPDPLTIDHFVYHPSALSTALLNTILPVLVLVGAFLLVYKLMSSIRSFLHIGKFQ